MRSAGAGGRKGDRAAGAGSGRLNGMIFEDMTWALQDRCRLLVWLIFRHFDDALILRPRRSYSGPQDRLYLVGQIRIVGAEETARLNGAIV